jgi:hypothetical protein
MHSFTLHFNDVIDYVTKSNDTKDWLIDNVGPYIERVFSASANLSVGQENTEFISWEQMKTKYIELFGNLVEQPDAVTIEYGDGWILVREHRTVFSKYKYLCSVFVSDSTFAVQAKLLFS